MSFVKVCQVAENFIVKLAQIKLENLDWIEPKIKEDNDEYFASDELDKPYILDSAIWERAKKVVQPYAKNYKNKWSVIFRIYKKMKGRVKQKK